MAITHDVGDRLAELVATARRIRAAIESVIEGKPDASGWPSPCCSPRGTCSSRTSPASARPCWPRRWPGPSTARCAGSSSPPTCCPATSPGSAPSTRRRREFEFKPGPVFANIVVGDEINRASPKTQSALLECMEERQVTVDGRPTTLESPFMVIATQNPVEMEGTYPLPEAQRDRFMARISMGYPSPARRAGDARRARRRLAAGRPRAGRHAADVRALIEAVREVHVRPAGQAVRRSTWSTATREPPELRLGASPRATLHLLRAARALRRPGRPRLRPPRRRPGASPSPCSPTGCCRSAEAQWPAPAPEQVVPSPTCVRQRSRLPVAAAPTADGPQQ